MRLYKTDVYLCPFLSAIELPRSVFARKSVKPKTLFGPMEAERCAEKPAESDNSLEYQVKD